MAKTTYTGKDVMEFIHSYVDNEQKKTDSFRLITLMQEGDAPIIGFSPRKSAFSLYIYSSTERSKELLAELGKFKMGKACIYVKKLSDINISTLHELCVESIKYLNEHFECACRK